MGEALPKNQYLRQRFLAGGRTWQISPVFAGVTVWCFPVGRLYIRNREADAPGAGNVIWAIGDNRGVYIAFSGKAKTDNFQCSQKGLR